MWYVKREIQGQMWSSGIKKKHPFVFLATYLKFEPMYKKLEFFYRILWIFKSENLQFFPAIIIEFTMKISQNSNNEKNCKI
jgi:hypothetical protein